MHYHIHAIDPKAHLFAVTLTIKEAQAQQALYLPAWLPGSYMIRDFAKNLIDIQAQDANQQPLALTQLDKQTWRVNNAAGQIQLTYQVYAWDLSVRTAHLDTTHGFFNGSSVFLAAKGLEETPHSVTIAAPALSELADWKVATSMTRTAGEQFGLGEFSAPNYDDLIDHPVEMGDLTIDTFIAAGVPHDVVLSGQHRCNMARLCQDLKAMCEYQINLFGTPAPFDRYVFMTTVLGNGFGGLEHKASTALMCSRGDLPTAIDLNAPVEKGYRTYLSLCSHEYFHSWNVKRIKPAEFTPFDLSQEAYTQQLWAYEGITSYYDDFLIYRSGCVDQNQYLTMLSEIATRVYRGKGRLKQSLNDSSFNAWTKFYKQDENAANAIVRADGRNGPANVRVLEVTAAEGARGLPGEAPFDAIVLSGSVAAVPAGTDEGHRVIAVFLPRVEIGEVSWCQGRLARRPEPRARFRGRTPIRKDNSRERR